MPKTVKKLHVKVQLTNNSQKKTTGSHEPVVFLGGLEGDRTLDLTDANRALIPAELRARVYN